MPKGFWTGFLVTLWLGVGILGFVKWGMTPRQPNYIIQADVRDC